MHKIVNYRQETGTMGTAAEHVGYLNRNTWSTGTFMKNVFLLLEFIIKKTNIFRKHNKDIDYFCCYRVQGNYSSHKCFLLLNNAVWYDLVRVFSSKLCLC